MGENCERCLKYNSSDESPLIVKRDGGASGKVIKSNTQNKGQK
jgi:hypothetical protein